MKYNYIFGPVISRRLGLSLGVDLLSDKICSFNCIYCECGKTNIITTQRKEYVKTEKVINELDNYLKTNPYIDHITFSGSGEPTLHSGIGKIVKFLKTKYTHYKIALLTNSFLLGDKTVQEEIKEIDLVIPSLDAMTEESFKKINRPADSIRLSTITEGLLDFKKNYKNKIWIEIFIVPGINNSLEEIKLFKEYLLKLNPDKIQLNTLDRPGCEDWVKKATFQELEVIKDALLPLKVEIIQRKDANENKLIEKTENEVIEIIYSTLKRRPCTFDELERITGINNTSLKKILNELVYKNEIEKTVLEKKDFFKIKKA